jgi:hypothetical protein
MFNPENGPREPEENSENEKEKSPEELKFEQLLEKARHMPLEPNPEPGISDKQAYKESMRGAFLDSGDPEKMAIFRLHEAKLNLDGLTGDMRILENWEENKKDKSYMERVRAFVGGWKKEWEGARKEHIARLKPTLKIMAQPLPKNLEEARDLREKIMTFNNWQAIVDLYEVQNKNAEKE